jgi:hypothetical protein
MLTGEVGQPNVVGSAIVFGAWLLALVAFIVNVDPIVRDARAGLGGIVVDQYPCWVGVPNGD